MKNTTSQNVETNNEKKYITREQAYFRDQILKQITRKQINLENKDVKFYDVYHIKGTCYLEFVSDKQQDQKGDLTNEYQFIGRIKVAPINDIPSQEDSYKEVRPLINKFIELGVFPQ